MKITINKQDLSNLLAWAGSAKSRGLALGMPFDKDEEDTLQKLRLIQQMRVRCTK